MGEDLRKYLPRGTQEKLARKYSLTRQAVGQIIRREDFVGHPELMKSVMEIAKKYKEVEKEIYRSKNDLCSEEFKNLNENGFNQKRERNCFLFRPRKNS